MLAARHRARLAMQDANEDTQEIPLTRNLRTQNVRRKLFVDDVETDRQEDKRGLDDNQANEFFEEVRGNLEKAKQRWNFDFQNETPLPGNYQWIKLDKDGNQVQNSIESTEIEDCKKTNESSEAKCERGQELNQND